MNYYLVSLRYENYKIIQKEGFSIMGFSERSHIIDTVKPGDKLVLYIGSRKSLIAGIVEVASNVFYDNELIWDEVFPKRIRIKEYISLQPESFVPVKEVNKDLSFVDNNKKRFGLYYMQAIRKLSEEDYQIFFNAVTKK